MSTKRLLTVQPGSRQRGFSLIELIIFIVIVSVALTGVLMTLNVVTKNSADPLIRKQMLTIAEALIDEVQMRPFTYCDPEDAHAYLANSPADCADAAKVQIFGHKAGATRTEFDNLGNYCSETGTNNTSCGAVTLGTPGSAGSQIEDLTGVSLRAPAGYWASISLEAQGLGGVGSAATAAGLNVILITVEVASAHSDEVITLQGYRTRWAPRT